MRRLWLTSILKGWSHIEQEKVRKGGDGSRKATRGAGIIQARRACSDGLGQECCSGVNGEEAYSKDDA